ncbi:lamin tail domain-containing protein [Patescibacteria group bacterium]|nr:lamin tail domain-containing protein [Patescibacteria group bacterium]MBU1876815.1 lamin tail domain-containing protein [Patescibacteria group bacterium]
MERLRKKKQMKLDNKIIKKSFSKILVILMLISLNWTAISAVTKTIAYFNDTETSGGSFTAGALDFVLTSPSDFYPEVISPGESSERTINFLNNDNIPKYKVKTVNPSGTLCDYLTLKVKLDGVDIGYDGLLIDFDSDVVVFEPLENWTFILTLPSDAPEPAQGQVCDFNFLFYGSQIRNDLPFGGGFNDTEENVSSIASTLKTCEYKETRTMGYWKNHESVYLPHLPQTLGAITINSIQDVDNIFDNANADVMRDMLNAQLLAMKFNIAHFGIGEYFVVSVGKTIDQIVAGADDLLLEVPEPPRVVLETMKTLLDVLNNLHEIQICSVAPLTLTLLNTNGVVLNEFLPNPEGFAYDYDFGSDDSTMPQGEWVELYNNGETSQNIDGWYIWDASSNDLNKVLITDLNTYPATTIIPGNGWLVVYMNKAVLDNTGDTVKLFDDSDTLIDSYIYMDDNDYCEIEPTPGDENTTDTSGSCESVPPNKSYARIPDGIGSWIDPIPTPGRPNILDNENVIFETIIPESNEEITNNEILLVEEKLEPEDKLIIIDNLFLGSSPQLFLDFQLDEEPIFEEETPIIEEELITEEPTVEELHVVEETPVVEELIIEEAPVVIEETSIVEESIIEEPIVVEETPIVEESVIEEIPVIEESIIEEPLVVEETPIIEEAPAVAPENIVVEVAPSEPAPADTGVME